MQKIIRLTVLSFLISLGGLAQERNFQVKFPEPFAVFQFVDNLSANAPPNTFKTIFSNSKFNTKEYTNLIADYDQLNIDYGYDYVNYPYGQKMGGATISLLKRNLINSSSINEFKLTSVGIIPNADLFGLCDLLTAFDPVYQELLYQPCKEKFGQQLTVISNLINSGKLNRFLNDGLRFYHSSWDEQIPFTIALYPLKGTLHFTAAAFYNNAIVAVPEGLQDYNKLLSIIMHEIFYILDDEETLDLKKSLEAAFKNNSSKNSRYAYLILNEALATSLGNGYVYSELNGAVDTAMWYRRKYTNLMARRIYPLVKAYLFAGKSLDENFIRLYMNIFDQNFSGWLKEKDFIMTDRYLIADNPGNVNVFNNVYRYSSMSVYDPEITISSIEKMKRAPITKVVIISRDNRGSIELLKEQFKELENWQPDSKSDFTHTIFLADKTYLVIINNVKKKTSEQLEGFTIQ